ncbi:MAG: caspase family protein [Saprospiraceae bacterium]
MTAKTFLLAICLWSLCSLQAQQPQLVLPIIHGETVESMAFSKDNQYLVSSSMKYIKLWEANTGNLIRTIEKDGGTIFQPGFMGAGGGFAAVDIAPDASFILSGRDCGATYESAPSVATRIETWETKSGKLLKTLTVFKEPTCIFDVAISADAKLALAVYAANGTTAFDHSGLLTSVWDISSGKKLFDRPGEWGNFSMDTKHLITRDSNLLHWVEIASGKTTTFTADGEIEAMTASPDGQLLFAASKNKLQVWNIPQQQLQSTFDLPILEVYGNNIYFSKDAKVLTATKPTEDNHMEFDQYHSLSGEKFNHQRVAISAPMGIWGTVSPDGKLFAYAPYTDVGDYSSGMNAIDVSIGKIVVEFGLTELQSNNLGLIFESRVLEPNKLFELQGWRKLLYQPKWKKKVQGDELVLSPNGESYFDPEKKQIFNFQQKEPLWTLSLPQNTNITSISFSENEELAILTGDNNLNIYDPNGQLKTSFPNVKFKVSNGEFLFSSEQQKVFLLNDYEKINEVFDFNTQAISVVNEANRPPTSTRIKDSETWGIASRDGVSLSLFHKSDSVDVATILLIGDNDWVVATPEGLFDATPKAMQALHYVYEMELIELEQLKERYYEPGLLDKILGIQPGEIRDVSQFSAVKLYPQIEASLAENQLNVKLKPRNGGIGKLSLFINGKEVQEDINPSRQTQLNIDLKTFAKYYFSGKENTLSLRAYNQEGWLKSQAIELAYIPTFSSSRGSGNTNNPSETESADPHLYALIVGTSDYSGDKLDLTYADKDAAAIYQALQAAGKALFNERTHIQLLSTDATAGGGVSNKTNIKKALQDIAQQAKPTDVMAVYFSGHGVTYGQAEKVQFYYLTKDIGSDDLSDPEPRNNYAISTEELTSWLTAIPAQKQVMILDACNSGKVVESLVTKKELNSSQVRALDRMKDRTGMFVISGSAADKVSYEASQYGQGLLTFSLLQGMKLVSASNNTYVDVMKLFQYSRDRVPELAKGIGGIQTPMLAFPSDGSSFDIGIVKEGVDIPIAEIKPVFIRNNFQDEQAFDDVLGLGQKVGDFFKEASSRGTKAPYIYVDVSQYDNAYSIKGRYTSNGDAVSVRAALFKGTKNEGTFELSGSKNDLDQLVRDIIREVRKMIR